MNPETESRMKLLLSAVLGGLIGTFISVIVDSALFEISINGFFSLIFGISLILIGGLILWRVAPEEGQPLTPWRLSVFVFSIMVICSGMFCFLLEKEWITNLDASTKVPMYLMLGTSLCFALTFSVVDLVNQGACGCCNQSQHSDERLQQVVVQTNQQVYLVLVSSVIMGAVLGLSFGMLDVEDDSWRHERFNKDQTVASIVGGILGFIVGFLNQWLRQRDLENNAHFLHVDTDEDI